MFRHTQWPDHFPVACHVLADGSDVESIKAGASRSSRAELLSRLGLRTDFPVVAQVGGVVFWKGQQVTAEAFIRLAKSDSTPRFSLLFLGGGSSAHREKIERMLADAPREWQDAVRFVRFDPDDFSYLAAADIVVHPSVLPDPFPNAVREAMILGKPVIASRDGGIPEMITDGETGILFQPGNADEMAAALSRLVVSSRERVRLGEAARDFASYHFDIQVRKQAFMELFRSLVTEKA